MVKYVYDAWGNHAVLDADGNDIDDAEHIGNLNPFRYRGYYYDAETGLYYLQTRYYDPETGRFISQDSIEYADPTTVNGLNLYAYCLNNPIKFVDYSGCIPITNRFETKSSSLQLFGFHHKFWGRIIVTATQTYERSEEAGIFYSYSDINTSFSNMITWGAGINLYSWFGVDLSVNTEYNATIGINISPYFHINASLGLDGISVGMGLVIDNTSYDLTVGIGLAPLILIGGIIAIISGQIPASNVWDWFKALFS